MPLSPLSVTAIIPATSAPSTLGKCVAALESCLDPPDEIIVVREPISAGPALARNLGAEQARGDVLLFVDADVVAHQDAVTRVREAFARDDALAAVFGSYDDEPWDPGVVSGFRNLLHHHVHQTSSAQATTFWAGLGAVRRTAFLAVGGFDAERFRVPSIEDIDLGMRLTAAGADIRLDHRLQGTHLKTWRLGSMLATDFARRGVPWVALRLHARSAPATLNLTWRHRASASLVVLAAVAAASRRPRLAVTSASAFIYLNRPLYALLLRKRGVKAAAAGVVLHALHHLTAVAAVLGGIAVYAHERATRQR